MPQSHPDQRSRMRSTRAASKHGHFCNACQPDCQQILTKSPPSPDSFLISARYAIFILRTSTYEVSLGAALESSGEAPQRPHSSHGSFPPAFAHCESETDSI